MGKSFRIALVAMVSLSIGAFALADDEKDGDAKKAKHTVKEVMAKTLAPKGDKLNKKVVSGKATQEEKIELLNLYISLVESKAPKGDEASWQKFAGATALAAAKVVVGREDGIAELKAATKCAGCHKANKPAKKK